MNDERIEVIEVEVPPPPSWVWRIPVVIGALQVLFGIIVLAWPGKTLAVVAVLIGLNLVIGGVLRLALAAFDTSLDGRVAMAVWAVLGVLAGIVVVRSPAQTVAAMVLVLGAFWVVWGLLEAFVALTPSARGARGALLLEAAVAIGAGAVLLVWPAPTLQVLSWLAGLGFILVGVVALLAGRELHRLVDAYEDATT